MRLARASIRRIAWVAASVLVAISTGSSAEIVPRVSFEVRDADRGDVLLQGFETSSLASGRVTKRTVYSTPGGQSVQRERVAYDLDSLGVQSVALDNDLSGERLDASRSGQVLEVSYRSSSGAPETTGTTPPVAAGVFHAKVLHHLIVREWAVLRAGKSVPFELLLPSKLETYRFRLTGAALGEGLRVQLEPASWLLRQAVPAMVFEYGADRLALRYVGPNTVRVPGQDVDRVEIRFSY